MPGGRKSEATREAAALLLAKGAAAKEAATLCGASERTLANWQKDPAFTARVKAIQGELFGAAVAKLACMSGKAADELEALLGNADAKVRLGAVRLVAEWGKSVREADLAEQLAELRRMVTEVETRVGNPQARAGESAGAAGAAEGGGVEPAGGLGAAGPVPDPEPGGDDAGPLAAGPATMPLRANAPPLFAPGG
jgi:hypothetical protein